MPNIDKFNRAIQYTNLDFAEARKALFNYAKNYFPNQLVDGNETDPATMMIEMSAAVSDWLSYGSNISLQESLLYTADERINLYNIGQAHGYKPKTITPASVELDVFQLIPSIGDGVNTKPDFRYALYLNANMVVETDEMNSVRFRTIDSIDFRFSSSYDPTTVTVYSVTNDGAIEYYLLKKKVKAVSGELFTETFDFAEPKPYDKIVIRNENVTEIVDIYDNDNNKWYEVNYLSQDTIPLSIRNTDTSQQTPFVLCYKQTEFRYVTRLRKDNYTEIQFGAGLSSESDEEIIPNPMNVGLGLNYFERTVNLSIDPSNFLFTKTYGTAPTNTTLTVRYSIANGLTDNVLPNTITKIVQSDITNPADSTDSVVLETIKNSLAVNNPLPAWGGQNRKDVDVIRQEAMANFAAQNRNVTRDDYILRVYSMPSKYGAVAKVFVEQDTQIGNWLGDRVPNPYALNLYVLAYDKNKNFVECNDIMKNNIIQFLSQYRMLTDAINIKNPYIINISIDVEIMSRPNTNSNEVILRCLDRLVEMFKPENMGINEPIIISKIRTELDRVEGVETVMSINFGNLVDTSQGYSPNVYPIENAIVNGILYPSLTPSIFETKYLKKDIRVRIAQN
jgi:hypothetical protein